MLQPQQSGAWHLRSGAVAAIALPGSGMLRCGAIEGYERASRAGIVRAVAILVEFQLHNLIHEQRQEEEEENTQTYIMPQHQIMHEIQNLPHRCDRRRSPRRRRDAIAFDLRRRPHEIDRLAVA